jgi:hypothetical protein
VTQINVTNGGSYNLFSTPTVTIGPPTAGSYTHTFWSNNGTGLGFSASASEPTDSVSLQVVNGLYSVLLGDTAIPNMTAIPASVWANPDVRLRVWFSNGSGFQRLTPDQRLAPLGYLSDGSVASSAVADGAITSAKIATGAVTNAQLATNAVQAANIAAGAVGTSQLGSDVGAWSRNGGLYYYNAGNVGIGIPNPAALLHVAAPSGAGKIIIANTDGGPQDNTIEFRSGWPNLANVNDVTSSIIGAADANSGGRLIFSTASTAGTVTERMRIDAAGNVLIGNEVTCVAINLTSDRNAKEQFKPVNAREVLAACRS